MNPQKMLIVTFAVLLTTAAAFLPDAMNVSVVKPLPLFILAAGVFVWWIDLALRRGSLALRLTTLDLLVLLWVAVTGVSLLLSRYTGTGTEQFFILLASVIFYFLAANTFDAKSLERFWQVLVALAVALSVYGFIDVGVAGGSHRLVSTLGNPTTLATFVAMCLPFSLLLLFESERLRNKILLTGSGALLLATVFLSQVRSAWLAGVVGIAFMSYRAKSWKRLIPVLFTGAILIALLGALWPANPVVERVENIFSQTNSFSRRLVYWDAAWKGFLDAPLIGNGYGAFQSFMPRFRDPNYWTVKAEDVSEHAHNVVLEIFSETGVLGFSTFAAFLLVWFALTWKSAKENLAVRAVVGSVAVCLVDNLFSISFFQLPIQPLFWILAGATAAYVSRNPGIDRIVPIPSGVKLLRIPLFAALLAYSVWSSAKTVREVRAERAVYSGALSFYVEKDRDAARDAFLNAVEEDPIEEFALLHLGVIDYEREKPESALGWLKDLQQVAPYYPQSNLYLGLSYSSIGKTDSALRYLLKETLQSSHPRSYLALSQLYRQSGQTDEEAVALENVIRFDRPGVDSTTVPYYRYAQERLDSLRAQVLPAR